MKSEYEIKREIEMLENKDVSKMSEAMFLILFAQKATLRWVLEKNE